MENISSVVKKYCNINMGKMHKIRVIKSYSILNEVSIFQVYIYQTKIIMNRNILKKHSNICYMS